jgi:hypothetical protein
MGLAGSGLAFQGRAPWLRVETESQFWFGFQGANCSENQRASAAQESNQQEDGDQGDGR